jgi:hypothetical protein
VACLCNHCCNVNKTIHCLFIVDLHVAVKIKVFSVAMEMQQWVPFALLFSYRTFCTTVNNIHTLMCRYSYNLSDTFVQIFKKSGVL